MLELGRLPFALSSQPRDNVIHLVTLVKTFCVTIRMMNNEIEKTPTGNEVADSGHGSRKSRNLTRFSALGYSSLPRLIT
jgi:hypothetical protein